MKASELFGVVVRVAGFLVVLYSLWNVWAGFEGILENVLQLNQDSDGGTSSTFSYFAFGLPGLVFGLLCFFLADWIVKLAYRDAVS